MNFSDTLMAHIRGYKQVNFKKRDLMNLDAAIHILTFAYHTCDASEQLLLDAADAARKKSDPFCKYLAKYYEDHYEEEKGEIEILGDDLKSVGIHQFNLITPLGELAMAMIGTQYYLLKHYHPVTLLGYMAVQEADPCPIELVEKLEQRHGENLFRFVRLHAVKDIEHGKELLALIDSVPEELRDAIGASANNAMEWMEKV